MMNTTGRDVYIYTECIRNRGIRLEDDWNDGLLIESIIAKHLLLVLNASLQ